MPFVESFYQELLNYLTTLVGISGALVATYTTTRIASYRKANLNLKKDSSIKSVSTASLPPEIVRKYGALNEEELLKKSIGEYALEFFKRMREIIPEENQKLLINNLNSLNERSYDISDVNKVGELFVNINVRNALRDLQGKKRSGGVYSVKDNSIQVLEGENSKIPLFHELLHLSSAYYDKDAGIYYCGFRQASKGVSLGESLNEGYTEHLNKTIFFESMDYGQTIGYWYSTCMAKAIESIVGKDIMQKCYFNADLKGLVDELKQYASEEEIYSFIAKTDIVHRYLNNQLLSKESINAISVLAREANEFVLKTSIRKETNERLRAGRIPFYESVIVGAKKCCELLPQSITHRGHRRNLLDSNSIMDAYKAVKSEIRDIPERSSHKK